MVIFYVVDKRHHIFKHRSSTAIGAQPIESVSKTDVVTTLSGAIRHNIHRRDDVMAA